MSNSGFIRPYCRHQPCLYHIPVIGSYIQILRKYPHFLLLITYKNPDLKAQSAKQRNQKDLLGYVQFSNLLTFT